MRTFQLSHLANCGIQRNVGRNLHSLEMAMFKCVVTAVGVAFLPALALAQPVALPRPAVTGISHVVVFADNIQKSQQFYAGVLGWDQAPAGAASAGVRFYANHAQYVELLSPASPGLANHWDSVAFATTDAEAMRKYLGSRGVAVPDRVTAEADGSRSFDVHDPEGNKVGFTQDGKRLPAEPASAAQSLSSHIIHAGYVVHDRAVMDHFYKDLLGFHLYWQGGNPPERVNWVMMQVPDGTDWIEYMLTLPANPSAGQLGTANHFSPGVVSVAELEKKLEERGWKFAAGRDPKTLGVDGKMQIGLRDPDGTRVEFMEFAPVKDPCCSPYTGTQPGPSAKW
jgi:catechol 2,3-dioxygenase-like lactoylglutathione lyase family enzyme